MRSLTQAIQMLPPTACKPALTKSKARRKTIPAWDEEKSSAAPEETEKAPRGRDRHADPLAPLQTLHQRHTQRLEHRRHLPQRAQDAELQGAGAQDDHELGDEVAADVGQVAVNLSEHAFDHRNPVGPEHGEALLLRFVFFAASAFTDKSQAFSLLSVLSIPATVFPNSGAYFPQPRYL